MTALPFTGSIEFKLAIVAFDVRVVRKARADYAYAPPWPYCATQSGEECISDFQLEIALWVLAQPGSGGASRTSHRPAKRYWAPLSQLLTSGTLSTQVH